MTAIDFLVKKLSGFHDDFELAFSKEINEAKEIEKQQMKEAQVKYVGDSLGFKTLLENQFEDWYNEKYGNKKY